MTSDLFSLHTGDCLEVMRGMDANSVDAIVTDPPYGLSFMGKKWDTFNGVCVECGNDDACDGLACCSCCLPVVGDDARLNPKHGGKSMLGHVSANWHEKGTHSRGYADNDNAAFQAWCEGWAREAIRVAKPGAHILAFGATRTFHRLASAIEDAGWEMRDCIMWVYGSGFPKGLNLDGDMKGWGTALKPALEPIIVARKPLVGTVAANVMQHGTGALNIDGCRVDASDARPLIESKAEASLHAFGNGLNGSRCAGVTTQGRWPANLIHDGSEEATAPMGESARFFYCAKASKRDREDGLDGVEKRRRSEIYGAGMNAATKCDPAQGHTRESVAARPPRSNTHPTVKPTDLMRYLCRLVTPPNGVVLDPFAGSGSTGRGAVLEGFRFVGIEREAEYAEIARRRIAKVAGNRTLFGALPR
jgi:site-specific DNA-methyltransferase (adenine-specific)